MAAASQRDLSASRALSASSSDEGITKRDLFQYYGAIAPGARPLPAVVTIFADNAVGRVVGFATD